MSVPDPGAMAFLLSRRSRPLKTLAAPAPDAAALAPILTAALRVPDHGKMEPWRLIVVERAAMARLADLAEARARALGLDAEKTAKGRAQFQESPLAVVVIAAPRPNDKVPEVEQVLSAGAVCLGLVNAALASGWGACWLTGWVSHDRGFTTEAFGLTGDEFVAGIVHIGTQTTPPPDRPRPDIAARVSWVRA